MMEITVTVGKGIDMPIAKTTQRRAQLLGAIGLHLSENLIDVTPGVYEVKIERVSA